MASNLDMVKQLIAACEAKDYDKVRTFIAPEYTMTDPMMTLKGPDELIAMMKECPFECTMEKKEYSDAGERIILTADVVVTSPEKFTWRMCDIVTVSNGKVVKEEMFYDSAQFPKSVLDKAPGNKKPKAA